jgi:hypothetical protein
MDAASHWMDPTTSRDEHTVIQDLRAGRGQLGVMSSANADDWQICNLRKAMCRCVHVAMTSNRPPKHCSPLSSQLLGTTKCLQTKRHLLFHVTYNLSFLSYFSFTGWDIEEISNMPLSLSKIDSYSYI